jgi:hypothetical protein
VQQGPVRVHRRGPVAREQLERQERGAACGRAFVLEAAPQQLELLPIAELADRAVGDRPLAEVRAAGRTLELVVPLRAQGSELALGARRRQLFGLGGG